MNKNSGYSHVLKYTGLFGSAQVLGILCSLVRNKLVATILGLEGMGLIPQVDDRFVKSWHQHECSEKHF